MTSITGQSLLNQKLPPIIGSQDFYQLEYLGNKIPHPSPPTPLRIPTHTPPHPSSLLSIGIYDSKDMVPDSALDYRESKAKRYDNVIHEYMNFELINENMIKSLPTKVQPPSNPTPNITVLPPTIQQPPVVSTAPKIQNPPPLT